MPKENKISNNIIVQIFARTFSQYDDQGLLRLATSLNVDLAKVGLNGQIYTDLLEKCHEIDPIETSKYLVKKAASLTNLAHSDYIGHVMEKGMNENNPEKVAGLIKDCKDFIRDVEESEGIVLKEHGLSPYLTNSEKADEERPTDLQMLERHLRELKK